MPKLCPFFLRLAIENGSAAPTRNENAGWIKSCSEHPCHSTCSVLNPIILQNKLCGNACATTCRRITSPSMSTITSPRNASRETRRALGSVVISETVETATTGFSSCATSTMAAIQSAKLAIDQVVANPELEGAFQ